MYGGEYVRIFHADGSEVVNVEKTAVVNFVGCDSPKAQAIGLMVEEAFEIIETVGGAFGTVDGSQHLIQSRSGDFTAFDQGRQPALNDFLFPLTFPHFGQVGVLARGQVGQGGEYALQLEQVIVAGWGLFFYFRENFFQEQGPGSGGQRISSALRIERKGPSFIHGANQLAFQHETKLVGQEGQQDFVGELGLGRVPINIEVAGVIRAWPIF